MPSTMFIRHVVNPILDFLFPRTCLHCRASLPDGQQYVCDPCWNALDPVHEQHSLYLDTRRKLLEAGQVDFLISSFVFTTEGVFQSLAHELKYGQFEKLGVWLGRHLGGKFRNQKVTADYLIPIPLHKRKLRERGYNQAELIARGMSEVTGMPVRTDLVRRRRFTETQTKLHRDERKKNVEDAFEVIPGMEGEVQSKNIILIDDVITTGATVSSCAGTLKKAGAAMVVAASVALAE